LLIQQITKDTSYDVYAITTTYIQCKDKLTMVPSQPAGNVCNKLRLWVVNWTVTTAFFCEPHTCKHKHFQ